MLYYRLQDKTLPSYGNEDVSLSTNCQLQIIYTGYLRRAQDILNTEMNCFMEKYIKLHLLILFNNSCTSVIVFVMLIRRRNDKSSDDIDDNDDGEEDVDDKDKDDNDNVDDDNEGDKVRK